jgi:hypothetical protein
VSVTGRYPIGAQNFPFWRGMNNHAWARIANNWADIALVLASSLHNAL